MFWFLGRLIYILLELFTTGNQCPDSVGDLSTFSLSCLQQAISVLVPWETYLHFTKLRSQVFGCISFIIYFLSLQVTVIFWPLNTLSILDLLTST